ATTMDLTSFAQGLHRGGSHTALAALAAALPRGRLLIRPVAFPQVKSTLAVEVCSVTGSALSETSLVRTSGNGIPLSSDSVSVGVPHTRVSPLVLTPERIHTGVVL